MPEFSARSKAMLGTAHEDLQKLFNEVIKDYDCIIIQGHRGQIEQDQDFAKGLSKLKWPNGRHNADPSLAVDACPQYTGDWPSDDKFKEFADYVKACANTLNIKITWGGDWEWKDNDHFELS